MGGQGQSTEMERQLRDIAALLLLHGTLTECPGLVHGKMGIAIFFFHYARYTGNELFEEYAYDLIEEIHDQLHANTAADYEQGIAGIGVGMDYLLKNSFLQADEDIFDDFDQRMFRAVMYDPWQDFSLYDGLTGYGRYWMMRLPNQDAKACLLQISAHIEANLPDISSSVHTDDVYCFMRDLQETAGFPAHVGSCLTDRSFRRLGNTDVGNIVRMYQQNLYYNQTLQVDFEQIPLLDMDKPLVSTGLLTGYAGRGLLRLTALNQMNISWMKLL